VPGLEAVAGAAPLAFLGDKAPLGAQSANQTAGRSKGANLAIKATAPPAISPDDIARAKRFLVRVECLA